MMPETEPEPFELNGALPPGPLLLEASAGTGKTYSIAHLFVRLVVERGMPVDRILVVTFTEAATAELRDRVRLRLRDAERALRSELQPENDRALAAWVASRAATRAADADALRAALLDFDRAAISTIHGFCRRLLLRNAFESGTPFGLELGGEDDALRDEVVRDFLAREVHAQGAGRSRQLNRYGRLRWLRGLGRVVADPDVELRPPVAASEDVAGAPQRLADWLRAELPKRQAARHACSYDDLLRGVRDALVGESGRPLKQLVRAHYQAALVDEFQDTDPVQWAIFREVFLDAETPLYLIGDPKQAIYGFRGADLHTYLDAAREVAALGRVCVLRENHRSDPPLVAAFNRFFGGHPDPFANPRIRYIAVEPAERAEGEASGEVAPLGLRLVPRELGLEAVPRIVAQDIARCVAAGTSARGQAVLVRTRQQARDVQSALRAAGVPSVLHGAHSVFDSEEAEWLTDILAAMLDPGDQAVVRRALATPTIGLSAAGLLRLEAVEHEWERWVGRFREWNGRWTSEGFIRAFRLLLAELSLPATLLARVGGERSMTNLQHLSELLHRAEVREKLQPAGLLNWLRQHREDPGDDDAEQIRLESDDDAVELLTIHGAKGLEFGTVWVPFLLEGRGLSNADRDYLRFRDGDARAVHHGPVATKRAEVAQVEAEGRGEALRLLYVALTRAKHRCTLYWGALHRAGAGSPVAWMLFGRDAPPVFEPLRDRVFSMGDAEMRAAMERLRGAGIGVDAVRDLDAWTPPTSGAATPELEARRARRTAIDSLWRRTSFTGLTRGEIHGPLRPHDDESEPDEDEEEALVPPEAELLVPLHDFRAGALVGTCLHHVLEHHDFQATAELAATVSKSMSLHGLDPADGPRVTAALQAALETPFGGQRLADLPLSARLNELDFTFSVAGGLAPRVSETGVPDRVSRERMAAAYAAHGRPREAASLRALSFEPFAGFLTGSIDLVFKVAGKWHLADYKSNHLGPAPADYAPDRLAEAMFARHYFLQAHLYTVGLHRYLAYRLPDYDYERDVGAAWYLFLRGMDPAYPPGTGVHRDRLDGALVGALSEALS